MSAIRCVLLGAVLSLFLLSVHSIPQVEYTEDSKIAGSEWGYVGNSVALWRRRAVVGAIYTQNGAGAAFVMERGRGLRATGKWKLVENLIPTSVDLTEGDYYGQAVGIYGNTAAVSSLQMYHGKGAVFVFRREINGEWSEVTHLEPPETSVQSKDNYGYRVALYRNILLVSAPHHQVNGKPKAGRVFCYHMNAPASQEVLTSAVDDSRVAGNIRQVWESCGDAVPMSLEADDKFGSSLSVYGNLAAVGAPGRDMVHIFKKRGHRKPVFEYQTTLSPPAARGGDFGCALSMAAGGLLVVGAQRKATSTGQAYVYRSKPFRPFKLEATLVAEDKVSPNDYFGWSVAASSDLIAVGAPFAQTLKQNAGVVVIFRYLNESKSWDQGTPVQASRASHAGFTNSYFGFSVGVSKLGPHAHALLVGSPGEDKQKGAALVYRECSRDCKNLSVLDPLSCRCKCIGMWRGLDCDYCNPPTCAFGEVGVVNNGTCACGPRPPMPSVAPHMVPRNDSTAKEELDAVSPSIVGKGTPAKSGHATVVGKGPGSSYTNSIIGAGPTGGEGFRHVRTDDFKNAPCNATCGDNGKPHPSKCGCICNKHYSGSSCQVPPGCHSLNGLSAAQRKHHCVMRPHCHYHRTTGKCGSHKSKCHAVNKIHDNARRHKVCSGMSKCVSSCAHAASSVVLAQPDGSSSGLPNGGLSNGTSCSCGPAPASKAVYATRGGSQPISSPAGSTGSSQTVVGKPGAVMSTANGTVAPANQDKEEKLGCVGCKTPPGETKSTANATVAPSNIASAGAAAVPGLTSAQAPPVQAPDQISSTSPAPTVARTATADAGAAVPGVTPPPAPPAPAPVQTPATPSVTTPASSPAPIVARVAAAGGAAAVEKMTSIGKSTTKPSTSSKAKKATSNASGNASAWKSATSTSAKQQESPQNGGLHATASSVGIGATKIDHIKVETSGSNTATQKAMPVVNSESTLADVPESLQRINENFSNSGGSDQREMRPAVVKEKSEPGETREGNAMPFLSYDHSGRKMNAASKPTGGLVETQEPIAHSDHAPSPQTSSSPQPASSKQGGSFHEMKASSHPTEEKREKELLNQEESEGRHAASPVSHAVSDRKPVEGDNSKPKMPTQQKAQVKNGEPPVAKALAMVNEKVTTDAGAPKSSAEGAGAAAPAVHDSKVVKSAGKIVNRGTLKPPQGAFVASTALAANAFKMASSGHVDTVDVTPPSSEEASEAANEYVHYHRPSKMKPSGPSTFESHKVVEKHYAQTDALREDVEMRKEWEDYRKKHGIPNELGAGALSASGSSSVGAATSSSPLSKPAGVEPSQKSPTIADTLKPPQNATVIMTGSKEDKERLQAKKEKRLNMPPETDEERKAKEAAAERLDAHGPNHQDASSDVSIAHLAAPNEKRGEHVPTVVPKQDSGAASNSSKSDEEGHGHADGKEKGDHEGNGKQEGHGGSAGSTNSTDPNPSSYAQVPKEHSLDTMGNTTEYRGLQYQGVQVVPSTRGVGAGNATAKGSDAHGDEGSVTRGSEGKEPSQAAQSNAHADAPSTAPPGTLGKPAAPPNHGGATPTTSASSNHDGSKVPKLVNVTLPSDKPAPPADVIMNGSKEDKERMAAMRGTKGDETEEERAAKEKAARDLAYDAPDGISPASEVVVAERGNGTMSDESSLATSVSTNATESASSSNSSNTSGAIESSKTSSSASTTSGFGFMNNIVNAVKNVLSSGTAVVNTTVNAVDKLFAPPQNATVIMTGSKEDKERLQAKKEKRLNMPPETDEERKAKEAAAERLDAHGPNHQDASSDVSIAHLAAPNEKRGEHVPTVVPKQDSGAASNSSKSDEEGHGHADGKEKGDHEGNGKQEGHGGSAGSTNSTDPNPSSYAQVPKEHSLDTMGNTTEYRGLQYQGVQVVPSTRGVGAGNATAKGSDAHGDEGSVTRGSEGKEPSQAAQSNAHADAPSTAPPGTLGKPAAPPVTTSGSKEDLENQAKPMASTSGEGNQEIIDKMEAAKELAMTTPDYLKPSSDITIAKSTKQANAVTNAKVHANATPKTPEEAKPASPAVGSKDDAVARAGAAAISGPIDALASAGQTAHDHSVQPDEVPSQKEHSKKAMKPSSKPTFDRESDSSSLLPKEEYSKSSGFHEMKLVPEKTLDHPKPEPEIANMKPASNPTFEHTLAESTKGDKDVLGSGATKDHFRPASKATFNGFRNSPQKRAESTVKPESVAASASIALATNNGESQAPTAQVAKKGNLRAMSKGIPLEGDDELQRKRFHPSSRPTASIAQHPVVKYVGTHPDSSQSSAQAPQSSSASPSVATSAGGAIANVAPLQAPTPESNGLQKDSGVGAQLENLVAHPKAALDQIKKELGIDFDEQNLE